MPLHPRHSVVALAGLVAACATTASDGETDLEFVPDPSEIASRIALPDDQNYGSVFSTSGDVQVVSGVGLLRTSVDATDVDAGRLFVIGTRDPSTDAVTITDMIAVLRDGDGREAAFSIYDSYDLFEGSTDAGEMLVDVFPRGTYMTPGSYRNFLDGIRTSAFVYGVETSPADMPVVGTVTYDGGGARLFFNDPAIGSVGWDSSDVALSVDFDTGTVDFALDNASTPLLVRDVFDRIEVDGMRIERNVFAGGDAVILDDGVVVTDDVLGGATTSDAVGQFYGPATPYPAEAGTVIGFDGPGTALTVTAEHSR